ncbi:hypothetical protein [Streptomyces europaeiscabiei]|uniref:hypothetical protein n=1 Tax=Streptomyces europaeiscabiei TaxID=146819 RepID=UPI0029B76A4D|nr:hypothetical protein [Streptomyces europaeiscabiei]MDX3581995.1 hypothetical protein [Streptomyces europaeiscabiei]
MTEQWELDAERRQAARLALIQRCGNPTPRSKPVQAPEPRTEREQRLAAGLIFADREDHRAAAQAEDRARRRRADAEVAQRDHLWQALRDSEGIDYADEWMNGGDAA